MCSEEIEKVELEGMDPIGCRVTVDGLCAEVCWDCIEVIKMDQIFVRYPFLVVEFKKNAKRQEEDLKAIRKD